MLTFASAFDKNAHTTQNGAVVQLVRTSACHAGGRGFESRPHRQKCSSDIWGAFSLLYLDKDTNFLILKKKVRCTQITKKVK